MQILIIKPSSLVDVIHALRIAKQIIDNIPAVFIDWVIKSELKPILVASGMVRRNFLYQRTEGIRAYIYPKTNYNIKVRPSTRLTRLIKKCNFIKVCSFTK